MKIEVAVLGFPSLTVLMVSVDVKHHVYITKFQSSKAVCVKVEVAVLGFPSLMGLMVSVDVKQHLKKKNHQNDSCIKMGSDESRFNVSFIVRGKVTRLSTDQNF